MQTIVPLSTINKLSVFSSLIIYIIATLFENYSSSFELFNFRSRCQQTMEFSGKLFLCKLYSIDQIMK